MHAWYKLKIWNIGTRYYISAKYKHIKNYKRICCKQTPTADKNIVSYVHLRGIYLKTIYKKARNMHIFDKKAK